MSEFETLRSGWYLIKTKVREELRAATHLENQEFEAYCPQYLEKGKEVILFPGYLFLRLCKGDLERYHKIRSTRGVSGIVTFNKMHQKSMRSGQGDTHCKQRQQAMLPQPIPTGEKIISDIEAIIWSLNGCKKEDKPDSLAFNEGEEAVHKGNLFKHLKLTFMRGMKVDRGLFLVEYIQSIRTKDGVEDQVVSKQTMEIPYKEVEKV